jgi:hypothetical protein
MCAGALLSNDKLVMILKRVPRDGDSGLKKALLESCKLKSTGPPILDGHISVRTRLKEPGVAVTPMRYQAVVELTRPDPADVHLRQTVATLHVHNDRARTATAMPPKH